MTARNHNQQQQVHHTKNMRITLARYRKTTKQYGIYLTFLLIACWSHASTLLLIETYRQHEARFSDSTKKKN
ncbi:hypothetical protein Pmani_024705 [Petrolisthes manimaculis]|uniref:Uncharacterized protein n=1 Tax=Petrolisthes manimaculis TaxID=1843537 RepID=A0AAE1TYF2_9EUCA|nr:hypothetical protein Pmani_024705 [Petrolisthes manimaculis]